MLMSRTNYSLVTILIFTIVSCGSGSDTGTSSPLVSPNDPSPIPVTNIQKNILLIISDDQGLDASAQYTYSNDVPNTPNLNSLASAGLVFANAWATPACTTTRASLITGLYPHNSNVTYVPAILTNEFQTLQQYLNTSSESESYASAVFGKWHLAGGGNNLDHPSELGIQYYAGNIYNMDDYFNWELTVNGEVETSTEYHTTKITDLAIDWIAQQQGPWFTWLAYSAPHSPFHLPPSNLHSRQLSGTPNDINGQPRNYYLAAIEAMDHEIGRLIDSLDDEQKANTLIIYIGDNGTPERVVDPLVYSAGHAKGSLYQGGIAVPLIISGADVTRENEREAQLVSVSDLFATIAQAAGGSETTLNDSNSFYPLLSDPSYAMPAFIFTEFESAQTTGWTVRSQTHKLIRYENGIEELFSLVNNFSEQENIISSEEASVLESLAELRDYAESILQTTDGNPINITDAILTNQSDNCANYAASYRAEATDVNRSLNFEGALIIDYDGSSCTFATNAIPNHHFNDGDQGFPNSVAEQDDTFEISATPAIANQTTPLSLEIDNAILLNGVKVDILAAGCFGVGDGKVGCNDMQQPWRYDPMHAANGFRIDSHNAHSQPDGTYHYHGSPFALFADDSSKASPVIGFAADGFPIFGSYFEDPNQVVRKATTSYRLKIGNRPEGNENPGGSYDGSFRDDYEYVEGLGDLDECNGMKTNDNYRYYITDGFPYVLGCFTGTPHQSFNKRD